MKITVSTSKIEEFRKQFNRFARKAERNGLIVPTATFSESRAEVQVINRHDAQGRLKSTEEIAVEVIDVTVVNPSLQFEGWSFAALVETLETGVNVFHAAEGVVVPNRYTNSGCACEHCNVNRQRNVTYLARHDDGRFVQVGSTCVKDYLGGNSLEDFRFASDINLFLSQWASEGVDRDEQSGSRSDMLNTSKVLTASAYVIAQSGFISRAKADEENGVLPTSSFVSILLDKGIEKAYESSEHAEKAEKVIRWAQDLSTEDVSNNDYLLKVSSLLACTWVNRRNLGILVSAIAAYDNAMSRKEVAKNSLHVGTVGKRQDFFGLVVTGYKVLPDYGYGCATVYNFVDGDGNQLSWKASAGSSVDLSKGDIVDLKATVKAHGEWHGMKKTELTRCKVI